MIPITRQDILAHQTIVPWSAQYQVEQDLLLCRAMTALFADLHKRKPPPLAGRFEKALPLRRAFLLAKAPMGLRRKAQG